MADKPLIDVANTPANTVEHVEDAGQTAAFQSVASTNDGKAPVNQPKVPGYQILSTLGRGGMGVVYLARHEKLNRLVALKMILASQHVGSDLLDRFRAEAEAVAKLKHPNIVQIYDIGEVEGCPYFSLEYLEGGSLAQQFKGAPQSPVKTAELVSVIAGAVHAAHQSGVIHRDLKPANILLAANGQPKVADFGLAKQLENQSTHTVSGSVLGTPSYMAPEQADGRIHDIGPRADVYALGAILYDALTGRPPFRGATMLETLEQVRTQEPVAPMSLQPRTPRDLETICLKCLQKEPPKRYESAQALADDLQRFLRHEPIQARSITKWERLARWRRRNPAVAALLATTALLLIVGLAVTTSLAVLASRRADRIEAMNADLIATTKESEVRGDVALKTLESVIQDIQTELANLPNAQKLRGRLLNKAMDGLQRLDEKLRTQKRADRNTALALLSMAEVFRQVGNEAGPKGPAAANQLYERAIAMFEKLHHESPDAPGLSAQLAEAYLLYGINLSRSDGTGWEVTPESSAQLKERPLMQRGLSMHRQSADLRRKILAANPDDPNARREVARALTEWAYQEVRAGDAETTRKLLEEAEAMWRQLIVADPNNVECRRLYAKNEEWLGDWYFDMKDDVVRCEPYYRQSLELFQRLAEEYPNDADLQMKLANSWSRIADMYRVHKDFKDALAASQNELAITQKLEKAYPDNVQIISDCIGSYDHNWRENSALGNLDAALAMIRRSFDMRLKLIADDPDNRTYHSRLIRPTHRLGALYQKFNKPAEAIRIYKDGLSLLQTYVKKHPDPVLEKDIAAIQKNLEECQKTPDK